MEVNTPQHGGVFFAPLQGDMLRTSHDTTQVCRSSTALCLTWEPLKITRHILEYHKAYFRVSQDIF